MCGLGGQWTVGHKLSENIWFETSCGCHNDMKIVNSVRICNISNCSGQNVVIIICGGHMAWFKTWPRGLWSSCWMTARSLRYYKSS